MMSEVRQITNFLQGGSLAANDDSQHFHLYLTIEKAVDLPKMDVLHGIDSYCVINVQNMKDEVFQTSIIHKNMNPVWNEEFKWKVPIDTKLMTIAVIDHDTLTDDDLVCVRVCMMIELSIHTHIYIHIFTRTCICTCMCSGRSLLTQS